MCRQPRGADLNVSTPTAPVRGSRSGNCVRGKNSGQRLSQFSRFCHDHPERRGTCSHPHEPQQRPCRPGEGALALRPCRKGTVPLLSDGPVPVRASQAPGPVRASQAPRDGRLANERVHRQSEHNSCDQEEELLGLLLDRTSLLACPVKVLEGRCDPAESSDGAETRETLPEVEDCSSCERGRDESDDCTEEVEALDSPYQLDQRNDGQHPGGPHSCQREKVWENKMG